LMSLRQKLKQWLLPQRARRIDVLHRSLYCSPASDFHILRLALSHRLAPCHHELASIVSLLGFIGPGMTFVDVGANIGLFSTLFASVGQRVGFDVVAVEPDPKTFERLKASLIDYDNCTLHNLACSDTAGHGYLHTTGDSLSASLEKISGPTDINRDRSTSDRRLRVRTVRLDELCPKDRPLIVKIDVEGHESEVLAGAEALFQQRCIAALLIDGIGKIDCDALRDGGFHSFDSYNLNPVGQTYSMLFAAKAMFPGLTPRHVQDEQ